LVNLSLAPIKLFSPKTKLKKGQIVKTRTIEESILVTGGVGHVGSELIKKLLEIGYKNITCLDNYSNGSVENHYKGCEYVNGNTSEIRSLFSGQKFDTIFHFGEFARVEQSFVEIDTVYKSNYIGTLEVLKFAQAKRSRLIYSCSSAITSMDEEGIINSPYVISKRSNRELLNSLFLLGKLTGAIVYFSNVYGGNEKAIGPNATVVAKFLRARSEGAKVKINFPGTQTRNFTYIDDVIDGLLLVYHYGEGDNYFIASDEPFSILELAEAIGVEYEMSESVPGNRASSKVDLRAMQSLGWTSRTKISDYIRNELKINKYS
jgi:UDP-glucose 4-epimerase